MTLTEDKFQDLKSDYIVYGPVSTVDEYGIETSVYSFPVSTINTMWKPVSDEAAVMLYGEDVKTMLEGVVYDAEAELSPLYQMEILGERYEIASIKFYNTHRLVRVRRIKSNGGH